MEPNDNSIWNEKNVLEQGYFAKSTAPAHLLQKMYSNSGEIVNSAHQKAFPRGNLLECLVTEYEQRKDLRKKKPKLKKKSFPTNLV